MTAAPLNWIQEIHQAVMEAKQIPLHGFSPVFPWEEISQRIAALFETEQLKMYPRGTQFLTGNAITEGFGAGFISIALEMAPLPGQVFWIMAKDDVARITALALIPGNGKGFSSQKFQEGFYYFLATQALQIVNSLKTFGDLAPKIGTAGALPHEESLCIDVEIKDSKQAFWGRLVCPAAFHQAFKAHYSKQEPASLTSAMAKQIDVSLSLEVGRTVLSYAEYKGISVGDFVLLDRCTFDPSLHKGTVLITLGQTPLFRARIKENSLKIVDYAFYREEQIPMNDKTPGGEENPEEFEAEETSQAGPEEDHLWSPSPNGEQMDEKMIETGEIPMTLTVEVARVRMNLEKLLQLAPGNVLELPVKPEYGVDLTIGGKKVAKAELIKLGEMLGVKILQIGE